MDFGGKPTTALPKLTDTKRPHVQGMRGPNLNGEV